jgi:hypothetical protein
VEDDKPRYFIDEKWFTEHNKSFRAVAQTRMCASCRKKIGTEVQERVPTIDPRGRVVYEMRSVPFASNPLTEIRRHCSKESGYLNAETPVVEALFRVFLANGNQPIDLETIREQLATYVPPGDRPRSYTPELLTRLLESDNRSGLSRFELSGE